MAQRGAFDVNPTFSRLAKELSFITAPSVSKENLRRTRSEEHTSELQSPCISYAVFCLKKKNYQQAKTGVRSVQNAPVARATSFTVLRHLLLRTYVCQRGPPTLPLSADI